uniref:Interleukin 4/13A n=1 Tax=Astatotilapia calliptera TaxID=8154 RepID=A0AAX7TKQ1_ASTCA
MEMMMMMLVLVSAALMSPCAANPVRSLNLDHIIDLADQYNKTMYEKFYVEDVTHLVKSGCRNKFFCRVHDILKKHDRTEDKKIVRNLDVFFKEGNVNCTEELINVPHATTEKPIPFLLENLANCIRRRNFMGI